MLVKGCFVEINRHLNTFAPYLLDFVPDHLKTQEMCTKAVCKNPYSLKFVPDPLESSEMCAEAVRKGPWSLRFVPIDLITQEIYNNAMKNDHGLWNMFLISTRPKRCVSWQYIKTLTR